LSERDPSDIWTENDSPGDNANTMNQRALELDYPLDPGIEPAVNALRDAGIETFESCEGGPGHAYYEPTVLFHGDRSEGLRALAVAIRIGLRPFELRRVWPILDGEATGPYWAITFRPR
jgi:hypothetical protein